MGFILPFALMFVAIPLESFVHSLRTVMGIVGVASLRSLAWVLRLIGNISRFTGLTLINLYDVIIFAPLWIEKQVKSRNKSEDKESEDFGPEKTVNIRGVVQ